MNYKSYLCKTFFYFFSYIILVVYVNNYLNSILSGVLIGTGMVLPGVSGSVIAIMLGVYDQVVFTLNNSNLSFMKKIICLLPLSIGIILGILVFGKVLLYFYDSYSFVMMYIFTGLILGSIPSLKDEIKRKNSNVLIRYTLVAMCISALIFVIPRFYKYKVSDNLSFFNLFLAGLLYIFGKVVPGISSSLFLMILGLYDRLLIFITNPLHISISGIITFFPFFLGIFTGLYFFLKLINLLLNKYFEKTYSSIIGFVCGSIFAIFPGVEFSLRGIMSFALMACSYLLVYKLSKK